MGHIAIKLLDLIVMLLIALTVVFFMVNAMPGDPAYGLAISIVQSRGVSLDKALETARNMMGIKPDETVLEKYVRFIKDMFTGNFGYSTYYKTSVNEIISESLPWTLFVIAIATALGFLGGTTFGASSAQKRGKLTDTIISTIFTVIQAIPAFVLAIFLLFIGGVVLRVLPLGGAYPIGMNPEISINFILTVLHHALGPIIAVALPQMASWGLAMRGNCINVIEEDFTRFAYARGLRDFTIAKRYVKKNAILPLVASLAITIGYMLGGQTLVETVFNYPGIGFYFGKGIATRDFGLMAGLFSLIVIGVILATFITELLYIIIDPRVKAQ